MQQHEKQAHVNAWQNSGLTKAAYARQHGINSKTFGRWCRHLQLNVKVKDKPALVPVTLQAETALPLSDVMILRLSSGHRLDLPLSISPRWVAELLQCQV